MDSVPQGGYATSLASEFYVLSALYRLGLDANLTLGNTKGVDSVVARGPGRASTIATKAVARKNDWLVGRLGIDPREQHYVVLVSHEGEFDNPAELPSVWVFHHDDLSHTSAHRRQGVRGTSLESRYEKPRQISLKTGKSCGMLRSNTR